MRIEFSHTSLPALPWSGQPLRVGCAAGNDVLLAGAGVDPHHVVLRRDARGIVLEVCTGAARVYVNARPVREKALLRCGDCLGIGACRLQLVDDAVRKMDADTVEDDVAAVAALRVVAGPQSGQVLALDNALALDGSGRASPFGGQDALVLEPHGHRVHMDAGRLGVHHDVRVNGLVARMASLVDGDQLTLGGSRFVLDISADAAPRTAEPAPAVDADAEGAISPRRRGHSDVWWLLLTAALLAMVLVGVLWMPF